MEIVHKYKVKTVMDSIDEYLDHVISIGDNPSEDEMLVSKELYSKVKSIVENLAESGKITFTMPSDPEHHTRKSYKVNSKGRCAACDGWGCWGCCRSEQEIRGRQGTFG